MTNAELRKLYYDMQKTEDMMLDVGERMAKAIFLHPEWKKKSREIVGASGILAGWLLELDEQLKKYFDA